MTKPVRDSDGRLLGIVYVDVALETFLDLFSRVRPEENSGVVMVRSDGRLLFGDPFISDAIDMSLSELSLFRTHLPNAPTGTYSATAPRAGDSRILSYRKMTDWPLVLAFDLSIADVMTSWRQRAIFLGLAGFGSILVILSLTLWLSLQFRRGEASRRTLLLRERSLEEAQRLAGVGHFERDIATGDLTWAENMYAIHGVSPDTFSPSRESFLGLVVGDARISAAEQVHHFDFPPTNGHLECKIFRPDNGTVRDMVYDWEVIRDHDGRPIKAFGVAQDVTELKVSEGKAWDNEARLRDITECMSDFIWETDHDGVITYFESGSNELTLDIEIGATKDENIDTSEGEGDLAFMAQAIARQQAFRNLTFALRNKEKEVRWVRVSANPRFNQDGAFIGFRGAGADITEQRRQRIVESERSKGDALDRLAGGIAHEINNLLQPVVVYSSMGESETPQLERTQGYFRKIFTASQQAISIVQDILTFAREGRARPEPVCLASAISEGLDIIRPTLPSTIGLSELSADVKLDVAANVGGLHQVLFNFIRNAVDAAGPNGKVSIDAGSVVLNPRDADRWAILPGRYGYFSVTDDGPGVDEQNLSKVFDPFFTTKPHGDGTGLGLSVVAGMVREWGGAVDVRSQPGQTVFTAYMPLIHTERLAAE